MKPFQQFELPLRWLCPAFAALVMVAQAHTAFAAAPPANAVITNQASASYTDGSGNVQIATSNTVQTVIQQVGSFTLSPGTGYTKSGAAGATIYNSYTLTNTGNGTDNFTITTNPTSASPSPFANVAVYLDADINGLPDSSTPISGPLTIPAGVSYNFVVAYMIPGTANSSWYSSATVTATAANASIGYTSQSQSRTDTLSIATGAVFSATKSIGAPAVSAPSSAPLNGIWPAAISSGPVGSQTVYTIHYANNGAANGNFFVQDTLPAGLSYVVGSAVWSGQPGVALTEGSGGDPIVYEVSGTTIRALVTGVAPAQSGTLSFVVTVKNTATIGTGSTNNVAEYVQDPDPTCVSLLLCPGWGSLTQTNAPFTVLATRDVVLNVQDATNGTPNGAGDTVTVANAVPGGSSRFIFAVTNNGNDTDSFDLSIPSNNFPAGTQFNWFEADGYTPLQNTSGNSNVDTGPMAKGSNRNIVLQIVLPINATVASPANLNAVVLATSVGQPLEFDAAQASVTNVLPGVVDILNSTGGTSGPNGDIGPGTTALVNSIAVTAGGAGNNSTMTAAPATPPASLAGSAVFKVVVKNNDTGPLTFSLAASSTSTFPGNLPAGWTVDYYTDAAATSPAAGSVGNRNTGAIAGGGSATLYAKVTPPVNAAADNYNVFFQTESTTVSAMTGATVRDFLRDQVVVAVAGSYSITLSSASSKQASPGNVADYAHTLSNTGNNTCGASGMTVAVTGLPAGWSSAIYLDDGTTVGQIDGSDTLLSTGTLSPLVVGGRHDLIIRVFVSGSAAPGDVGTATVTITDTSAAPNCGSVSVSDMTTVVAAGQMQVVKYQRRDASCNTTTDPVDSTQISAAAGDCIVYKVVATNAGSGAMTSASLNDVVPSYTTWAATQPTSSCVTTGTGSPTLTRSPAAATAAGTTLKCGTVTSLPSNGTITLRYRVRIDQ